MESSAGKADLGSVQTLIILISVSAGWSPVSAPSADSSLLTQERTLASQDPGAS